MRVRCCRQRSRGMANRGYPQESRRAPKGAFFGNVKKGADAPAQAACEEPPTLLLPTPPNNNPFARAARAALTGLPREEAIELKGANALSEQPLASVFFRETKTTLSLGRKPTLPSAWRTRLSNRTTRELIERQTD